MSEDDIQATLEVLGLTQAHRDRLQTLAEWDKRPIEDELAWNIDQEYGARISASPDLSKEK